jgi:DNA-binding MarR family transcriptional regulator
MDYSYLINEKQVKLFLNLDNHYIRQASKGIVTSSWVYHMIDRFKKAGLIKYQWTGKKRKKLILYTKKGKDIAIYLYKLNGLLDD